MGFVAGPTLGPPLVLHLGLEDMPRPVLQLVPDPTLVLAESRPVDVVELLDDLKRPSAIEHVAADHVFFHPVGDGAVPGGTQLVARLTEQQVCVAYQLMKRVQVTAGALDVLQRLGHPARGLDSLVTDPVRPAVQAGVGFR